jgi:hypothetical protein
MKIKQILLINYLNIINKLSPPLSSSSSVWKSIIDPPFYDYYWHSYLPPPVFVDFVESTWIVTL